MPLHERRISRFPRNPPFLKQLQLLTWGIGLLRLSAIKQLNVAKLLVSDAHNANLPEFGQDGFHTFAMNLCILHAGTMAHVDGKLKHGEPVLYESFAEFGLFLAPPHRCPQWGVSPQ